MAIAIFVGGRPCLTAGEWNNALVRRQLMVKKLENKIVYYKETVECQHLIFWPGSQGSIRCHTAKLEPNQRVRINEASFLDKF
jgi:hypothetical protein